MRWNCFWRYRTGILLLTTICCVHFRATAQTEKVLHRFRSGKDGSTPIGGLIEDASGNLYGTTTNGGVADYGTVFQLSAPDRPGGARTETVLYSFGFTNDGRHPFATLTLDKAGNLYGTTFRGGAQPQCYDCGTVFELVRPKTPGAAWTEKILYSFGGPDGFLPISGLLRGKNGNLYGTTLGGGTYLNGTVFELIHPDEDGQGPWRLKTLYSFSGSDSPSGGVVRGPGGALYGTLGLGGTYGFGGVYRLASPGSAGGTWSETTIYSLSGLTDGALPNGGVLFDRQGRLYATTASGGNPICVDTTGCGTVFQLTPPPSGLGTWSEQTLYEFTGSDDGAQPNGDLVFGRDGSLYGTNANGGPVSLTCPGDCGSVFRLTPAVSSTGNWTQTTLYFFTTRGDGHNPTCRRDPRLRRCTVRRNGGCRKPCGGRNWWWNRLRDSALKCSPDAPVRDCAQAAQ